MNRVLLLLVLWVASLAHAQPTRAMHDMAGDTVQVPQRIERVVTVGSVPVLNSLVFAVGEGKRIANGLPVFAQKPRWGYQLVFAPQTAKLPNMQTADYAPLMEHLLQAAPDVVLTMDRSTAQTLNRAAIPAVYLAWRKPDDVKAVVRLLGELFHRPHQAARYVERFDEILGRVDAAIRRDRSRRPKVLYFSPATLRQPHLIAEWWIKAAGGDSVTDDGRQTESRSFTMEQLMAWDPDVLIVSGPEEREMILREARFSELQAVRGGRVLVAPCGAHTWANRTSEQPLTILWAASKFHPDVVPADWVSQETKRFYLDLFGVDLSAAQIDEILAGGPRSLPVAR